MFNALPKASWNLELNSAYLFTQIWGKPEVGSCHVVNTLFYARAATKLSMGSMEAWGSENGGRIKIVKDRTGCVVSGVNSIRGIVPLSVSY